MESLLDSLCPDCFQPGVKNGVCEKCGCHVSALQQALILPPRTVLCNRYILGILLGRGGFGATYKACRDLWKLNVWAMGKSACRI